MNDKILYAILAAAWLQTVASIVSTYSKTMIRLRFASVLSNILGLLGGAALGNIPTIVRHAIILPIDIIRLREMRKLVASVRSAAKTDLNVEWLKPFMHPCYLRAGTMLFHKGDVAQEAYMLVEGEIELPEIGKVLLPGSLFGEMALFTASGQRTTSVRALSDCRLLSISYEQFEQLYFQNPEFGLYLVRLIVQRFDGNMRQLAAEVATLRARSGEVAAE